MKNSPKAPFDVVIVGSGPAGVSAAHPLVKAGLNVCMIDGGLNSKKRNETVSSASISTTRSNALDILMKGSFTFGQTYKLLRVKSNIEIIQTLAKGGLSEIWHGICDCFTAAELNAVGLPAKLIEKEYTEVAWRAGLNVNPPLDSHCQILAQKAAKQVYRLSILYPYRTSSVVDNLKKYKNFTYMPGQLVLRVKDNNNNVETQGVSIKDQLPFTVQSRYLVLATGAVNTTRILLQSFKLYNYKVPFLTKGHTMVVCFHPRILWKKNKQSLSRRGQVALECSQKENGLNAYFVQFYRCNPHAQDLALQYIPLPKPLARLLFSMIAPCLVIVDIRFPTFYSNNKYCLLKKGKDNTSAGVLEVSLKYTNDELAQYKKQLKKINKKLWSLGLIPFKKITSDITSHYAGGVPFQVKPGKLSTDWKGKLHQAKRIYLADSSTWRALPAKPPTLTIMANAARVGKNVLAKLSPLAVNSSF